MDGAAKIPAGVSVEIGERRILLPRLMVGQGIVHDGVLGHLGQGDVLAHVIEIGAVVLAHDEKLAAVAEHGGADARLLETRIPLHDGNVPAIELAQLGIGFLNDFLPAGDVEETGDLLIDIAFPQRTRQRDDVFARVIGDEEAGSRLQLLGRLRYVTQLEMGDFSRQRKIARTVEQAAVVAVATPRQDERGNFDDLIALGADRIEHHQFLQHAMRRKFLRHEISEGEIADFARGLGFFQEAQDIGFRELGEVFLAPFVEVHRCFGRCLSVFSPIGSKHRLVAEVRKSFEGGRAGRHPLGAEFLQRQRMPGDVEQLVMPFLLPVLK